MLRALCVIALSVLFSGGPVRLCCIFVKFSGFVVIGVCHVGSISSAPSAQQPPGLRAVPGSHRMVCEGLQSVPSNMNSVLRCNVPSTLSDDGHAPFSDGDRAGTKPSGFELLRLRPRLLRKASSWRRVVVDGYPRRKSECHAALVNLMVTSIAERTHCEHPTRPAFRWEDFPWTQNSL